MERKYILTEETKIVGNHTLHRIKAVRDFGYVHEGDYGGFVETEKNLSHEGNCWVYDNAWICDNAAVFGNATVFHKAVVCGDALVSDEAEVFGKAKVFHKAVVCGDAMVYGDAKVDGNAVICGDAKVSSMMDYIVFKNWWSSGRYFTWTRSNDKWRVGCFYGSGQELVDKAYKDSERSGREYQRIVEYVENVKNNK